MKVEQSWFDREGKLAQQQDFMLPKTLEERNISMAQTTGKRDIFTSSNLNMFAKASIVPIGLYAFSKYQKYDTKKTLKVTIIGSVVILGAVVLNGLSGAWSGTTYLDSLMGKSKKPLEPSITSKFDPTKFGYNPRMVRNNI